jgi:hypothetical protein
VGALDDNVSIQFTAHMSHRTFESCDRGRLLTGPLLPFTIENANLLKKCTFTFYCFIFFNIIIFFIIKKRRGPVKGPLYHNPIFCLFARKIATLSHHMSTAFCPLILFAGPHLCKLLCVAFLAQNLSPLFFSIAFFEKERNVVLLLFFGQPLCCYPITSSY